MFKEIFYRLAEKINHINSIGIWGSDGLELENIVIHQGVDNFELIGAEVADVLKKMGSLKENSKRLTLNIEYGNKFLLIRPINDDFFIVVSAKKEILINKLDFFIDINKEAIIQAIS